ncbi:MAG: hypothetical protein ABJN26_25075 [Stappiaceae bacterium]
MAHVNKVLRSFNLDGEHICVDIFVRPDGTYGFDEYRRDPEDMRGWYSIGHFGDRKFGSEATALSEAVNAIGWLTTDVC